MKKRMPAIIEGESEKAFGAARCYFELGASRSVKEVSRILKMKLDQVEYLKTKYKWDKRAKGYDLENVTDEDIKQAERQAEFNARVHTLRLKMLERAEQMMKFPLSRQRTIRDGPDGEEVIVVEPLNWKPDDAIKLTKASLELGKIILELGSFDESLLESVRSDDNKPKSHSKVKRRRSVVNKKEI